MFGFFESKKPKDISWEELWGSFSGILTGLHAEMHSRGNETAASHEVFFHLLTVSLKKYNENIGPEKFDDAFNAYTAYALFPEKFNHLLEARDQFSEGAAQGGLDLNKYKEADSKLRAEFIKHFVFMADSNNW